MLFRSQNISIPSIPSRMTRFFSTYDAMAPYSIVEGKDAEACELENYTNGISFLFA